MAYTVPHTWVAGDFLRASWLNLTTTDLVDHEARIVALEATGVGDVVGPSASIASEIALFDGTTGKLLKRATGTGYVKVASGVYQTPSATIPLADVTGAGDVIGQASSVDSEIALFSGTGGKTMKRATTTGVLKATSGVIAAATAGTDYVSPTGTETLTNKTLDMVRFSAASGIKFNAARLTLTDAQIKALPTTPITLAAAAGAGIWRVPVAGYLRASFAAGAYTNVNTTWASLQVEVGGIWMLTPIVNDNSYTTPLARLTAFMAASTLIAMLGIYQEDIEAATSGLYGQMVPSVLTTAATVNNQPIRISIDNNGSGNLTGGNGANTLEVTVVYLEI